MFSGSSNFVETFQVQHFILSDCALFSWPRSSVQSTERIIKISLRACEQFPMPGIPTVAIGMAAVES